MAAFSTTVDSSIKEYRLLLVGRTGAGKSATGNTILGTEVFQTSIGLKSNTSHTQCSEAYSHGCTLVVVDTPGFFDTKHGNDFVMQELIKMYGYLAPGFHALIYVMGPDRFTNECVKTKNLFIRAFGERATDYTIMLVTGLDRIEQEGSTFRKFLAQGNSDFTKFRHQCNNRVVAFNNKADDAARLRQVDNLLDLIRLIQGKNSQTCFTNFQFQTMRLYKRLQYTRGKTKIKRARRSLLKKIADRYGVEQKYAWGPDNREPSHQDMFKALPTSTVVDKDKYVEPLVFHGIESDSEADQDYDSEDESGHSVEDCEEDNVTHRKSMKTDPSYLARLVGFFSRLFRPLIDRFLKPVDS